MSTTITDKGIITSGYEETRQQVAENWKAAFRDPENPEHIELNTDPYTPQGQLIDSETAIIMDKDAQFQSMAANMNPVTAGGQWQDAIGAVYFITRKGALPTYVFLLCTGLPGTVLPGKNSPSPAMAEAEDKTRFICTTTVTIGADGTVLAQFESLTRGPVPAGAGTITKVYKAIPGWDAVTNPESGVIGRNVESRMDFETRRRDSVARNATGSVAAVYANLAVLDDVADVRVYENVSWKNKQIGAAVLSPKSVYVSIIGGTDEEIAQAIHNRNSGGTDTCGDSSYTVIDPVSGMEEVINFQRADTRPYMVRITTSSQVGPDVKALIRKAVYENAAGLADAVRVRIGDKLYASRFYKALTGFATVINIQVALKEDEARWGDFVNSEIFEILTLDEADVEVLP